MQGSPTTNYDALLSQSDHSWQKRLTELFRDVEGIMADVKLGSSWLNVSHAWEWLFQERRVRVIYAIVDTLFAINRSYKAINIRSEMRQTSGGGLSDTIRKSRQGLDFRINTN